MAKKVILFLLTLVWGTSMVAQTKLTPPSNVIPPSFFGMHVHFLTKATPWPAVRFSGWRLWDASVSWPYLEPERGRWQFELLDRYVGLAEENDVEILLLLGESPSWASARPGEPSATLPGVAAEPADINDWRHYVRVVGERYRGRIRTYEIWNEPNLKPSYTGTVEMMVSLVEEATRILKEIDSTIVVVSPSVNVAGTGLGWMEEFFRLGGGKHIDVIGAHFYVFPESPESMLPLISEVKSLRKQYGLDEKPLWNTEIGWAKPGTILPEMASSYVARTYLLNWAAGVERVYWYAWDNHSWVTLYLTEKDACTPTPAGRAYAEIQRWLVGARMISYERNDDSVWIGQFVDASNDTARIVWRDGTAAAFMQPEAWGVKTVFDLSLSKMPVEMNGSVKVGELLLLFKR